MSAIWMRRLTRELAWLVILGTPAALIFLVVMPRSDAAKLLRTLNSIQINQTHFNQVEALAGQYGAYAACVGDNCLFQFQNQWLHRLHLAPLTEFTVMLQRGGDIGDPGGGEVANIDMAMLVSRDFNQDGGAIASAMVFDRGDVGPDGPFQASIDFQSDGRPDRTVVTLSPQVTTDQRRRARGFDLSCLTRIGGCKDSHQLLPGIWQNARHIQSVQNKRAPVPAPFSS